MITDFVDAKELSRLTKEEWKEYTKTVWHIANTSDPDHPAVFPTEIPRRLVKLFSLVSETVLDPFAGIGTTAAAALDLERNVICIEQNERYVQRIRALRTEETAALRVIQADSRDLSCLGDNSVDLVVTSPPYWNKADYGSDVANVGRVAGYTEFFNAITPAFRECMRVLAPGRKLCLVTANVNQYTEHGLLTFPLAADFIVLLRQLGFLLLGEVIWSKDGTGGRWGSWGQQRPIFGSYPYPPNFLFKTVHEHILVFIKPPVLRKTGPKVMSYDVLMGEPVSVYSSSASTHRENGNGHTNGNGHANGHGGGLRRRGPRA